MNAASRISNGSSPLVSVIIPAYQATPYIAGTLDSVLAQTLSDYEIIVVNDGSPDTVDLERVLEPYRDRIVYIVQENRGQAGARNTGIRAARGEFFAFLDNDDQWEPEFLNFHTGVMQVDPSLDVHYCDAIIFGDTARSGHTVMEFTPSKGEATFERLVRRECTVLNCATLSRREAVLRAGMFEESLRHGEDIDLWLRIARQGGRIGYQRKILARCRLRGDSVSADVGRMIEGYLRVLKQIRTSADLTLAHAEVLDRQLSAENARLNVLKGKEALRSGNARMAVQHLEIANAYLHQTKIGASLFCLRLAPKLFVNSYRLLAH
jgi:glycosyltransferase involved in cell wall biosynthesis